MIYVTLKQPPRYHQMSLEEFLFGNGTQTSYVIGDGTNTRTYCTEYVNKRVENALDTNPDRLIGVLEQFNQMTEDLRAVDRHSLYRTFYIPKKSGGLRKIDAPEQKLMDALRLLKTIFEEDFKALYHTSAFAYVKHRSTIDAIKRHQKNESKWFGKYDISNFFGSTTPEFVLKMFSIIYPFSGVMKTERGREALAKAIDLAFLDGVLPQGTPISPLITNIMMIPIDHKISNDLRDFNRQHFIYTRYADDFLISSRYDFQFRDIEQYIIDVMKYFEAPFTLKKEKTRYGSSAGRNWNLGVMLNKDNQITIGYKKKRQFKAMLSSFVLDTLSGKNWELGDVQAMEGYRNYYRMIEGNTIDDIVSHIGEKYNVNVVKMIKEQIAA